LHPPQEVVPAYHDVARAMEAKERQKNEAEAQALGKVRAARAGALQIVRQAEAAACEKVRSAGAARAAFLARQRAREQLPWKEEWRLLREAVRAVAGGQSPALAAREYEGRRRDEIALQATLTDFRLFWDSLARSLAGREKVIVDSEKVPGRR